jgi:hypothetical protein
VRSRKQGRGGDQHRAGAAFAPVHLIRDLAWSAALVTWTSMFPEPRTSRPRRASRGLRRVGPNAQASRGARADCELPRHGDHHGLWIDPKNPDRIANANDGGASVSIDGGQTWTHPATARPPANFCLTASNRDEPAAFGISIDPANANRVFIGTNCGLAMSTDAGVTWTFIDPTPNDLARDVWDVVVHDGGIIDICGDDGHQRSTNSGVTWTTATGIPLGSGRCSIAVSPGEPYVIFAVSGNSLFESEDGGANWPTAATYTNTTFQGRIPFVVTNRRQGATYDLWFGDRNLFRRTCTTPSPANPGGTPRCAPATAWTNVDADAHDDVGDVAFAPGGVDACPILFSSDGGIYRNTTTGSPACHSPNWDQPTVTTHGLFVIAFAGSPRAGAQAEDLYLGLQDNGNFGTLNAGAAAVTPLDVPPLLARALGVRASQRPEASRAFLDFLTSEKGNAAFRACGRADAR